MKILVCIKQVTFLCSRTGINSAGVMDPESAVYLLNPYDEVALEEALRIKKGVDNARVTAICLGPPRAEQVLRYSLAMGADHAIHICDEKLEKSSPWLRARALVNVIEAEKFDLILCGKKAIDDNEGLVGGFIAELLGYPYIGSVTEIISDPDHKKVRTLKVLERGDRQCVECELPAVFSVEKGLTKPRYPTLKDRLLASKKEISEVNAVPVDVDILSQVEKGWSMVRLSSFRPKPKKVFTPDSNLPAEERIKLIMSGGLLEKKSNALKALPHELANGFVNFLEEHRIIKKRSADN